MIDILFPAGRMIGGNLDKLFPRMGDNNQPKISAKTGQPEQQCSVGVAIPKQGETHWNQTAWGKVIYDAGAAAYPSMVASRNFAWKITDGDSLEPNKRGKIPAQQTGYSGHWVIWFSQGWLPKRVNSDGTVELPEGAIVAGFYVQVYGSVAGNKPVANGTPGVYLNPIAVALVGEGDRIATDVDTTSVGFGGAALPVGARPVSPVVPGMPALPGAMPPLPGAATPPPTPVAPVVPAGPVMLPAAGGQTYAAMIAAGWTDALLVQHGMMQAPAAAPPMPVAMPVAPVVPPTAPNPGFLAPPPGIPQPPVPPTPAAPVMTDKAQGVTYDAFKAQGWTDDQLRQQGFML